MHAVQLVAQSAASCFMLLSAAVKAAGAAWFCAFGPTWLRCCCITQSSKHWGICCIRQEWVPGFRHCDAITRPFGTAMVLAQDTGYDWLVAASGVWRLAGVPSMRLLNHCAYMMYTETDRVAFASYMIQRHFQSVSDSLGYYDSRKATCVGRTCCITRPAEVPQA
jgi:hypothetical protein